MPDLIEDLIVRVSNWARQRPQRRASTDGLTVGAVHGSRVLETIATRKRAEHIQVLGKTGMGKSSLVKQFLAQDIEHGRGLINFDLHADTTPHALTLLAAEEVRQGVDLSDRVVIIEPGDSEYAVGINVLAVSSREHAFTHISEVTQLLKQRWHLESLGPRTEELLRNALLVLMEASYTLLELAPLLTDTTFRAACLRHTTNEEARAYFAERYDAGSDAMRHAWRDAVLNKISAFTADPHFRHMLGQSTPTFSLREVLDRGFVVLLNLDKGRLGEQALTLGALFLSMVKHELFARRSRDLVTLYLDEVQNFVADDNGIDTLLSEARKYAVGVCLATQVLDAYPPAIRAAVMGVGTHITFALSSNDANRMAVTFGGGHHLETLLKSLPPRQVVMRSGHLAWRRLRVPDIRMPQVDSTSLYERARARWARRRVDVEADIKRRYQRAAPMEREEALNDWE